MNTAEVLHLVDFPNNRIPGNWQIVDDVVMGGRSNGEFKISEEGLGVFQGSVSLENNGGFSSLRYRLNTFQLDDFSKIELLVKGDGKRYQFRVKSSSYDRHSYITYFQTDGDWQTITIKLSEMYPTYRGRKLNMSNYPGNLMEELAFLISNKKEENFKLEISRISLMK